MATDGNDNSTPQHPHFIIPEGEVKKVAKVLHGGGTPRDVHHSDHGQKLLNGLQKVEEAYRTKEGSVPGTVLFKMTLAEKENFNAHANFMKTNRITVNAVREPRTALVSIRERDLRGLKERINTYRRYDQIKEFQYLDALEPLSPEDKQSLEVRQILAGDRLPEQPLDIQVQLLPNLKDLPYDLAVAHVEQLVKEEGGKVEDEPFYISETIPVLHFTVPAESIETIAEDDLVYRIEITPTFEFSTPEGGQFLAGELVLNPDVVLDSLPTVGVVDTGVNFEGLMAPLCVGEWVAPGLQGLDKHHGTMVASRIVFGCRVLEQVQAGVLTPRAKVLSILVSDAAQMNGHLLMKHIEEAVKALAGRIQIFNVSINNARKSITDETISIFGNLLDSLTTKYGVSFVVSAGNQYEWLTGADLGDVFSDEKTRVASPGDSYLNLTVGAAVLTPEDIDVAPYTRVGPGFAGNQKVDLMGEGGGADIGPNGLPVRGQYPAYAINHMGQIVPTFGTSFAAPVVAGDLADLREAVLDRSLLLSRTLLINTTTPIYDLEAFTEPDDREWIKRVTGNGLSDPERAKLSTSSSATFVTTGTLNRLTRAEVTFMIPSILKEKRTRRGEARQPIVRVRVTVMCLPPLDKSKGQQYLGACILTSMHGSNTVGKDRCFNPAGKEGQAKWQPYQHFSILPHAFSTGDWKLHLELMTRWDTPDDLEIPFALAITVEDPSETMDVYSAIRAESQGRFQEMDRTQIRR